MSFLDAESASEAASKVAVASVASSVGLRLFARALGPQLGSGFCWKRLMPAALDLGFASGCTSNEYATLGSIASKRVAGESAGRFLTGCSLTHARIMSQTADEGASVLSASLSAWDDDTLYPALSRPDRMSSSDGVIQCARPESDGAV